METTFNKWHETATTYFDRYVLEFLSNFCPLFDEDDIVNIDELECVAQLISCDPAKLLTIIENSQDRKNRKKPRHVIESQDEKEIIKAAVKLLLKESPISMIDQKRGFGKVIRELNHQNLPLAITVSELTDFLKPIHQEAFLEKCNEIGRAELLPKKLHQLAMANFDRYVMKRMIEVRFVVVGGKAGISDRDLGNVSKSMNCSPGHLRAAVVNSCSRVTKEHFKIPIPLEDELTVMKAAAKLHIKEICVPMANYKREFGKIIREINHENVGLHATIPELITFVEPLYYEAVNEIYSN